MVRRLVVFVLPVALALSFAPASAARTFAINYQSAGTLTYYGGSLDGSGAAACNVDSCKPGFPESGSISLDVTFAHPPNPARSCLGTAGSGSFDVAWSDSTSSHVVLSMVSLKSSRGLVLGRGFVSSGALSGSTVRLRFNFPPGPTCPAGTPFTGTTTFHPPNPA